MRVGRRFSRGILALVLCMLPAPADAPLLAQTPGARTSPPRTAPRPPTPTPATATSKQPAQAPRAEAGARTTRGPGVTVETPAVVVERRRFDPRNPPPDLPPLGPRADAITQSRFGCAASVQYTVVSRRPDARGRRGERGAERGCTATARIESMEVKVDLEVTIWVPTNASPKLLEHEEGHRVISERVYHEAAAAAALAEARKLIGRTVTAHGDDCKAAADAAIKEANEKFCQAYLDATSGWSTRVGNRYDVLTSHGRRSRPDVDEAIRLSFEQEPQAEARAEAQAGPTRQ